MIRVYAPAGSGYSRRVRIALLEKIIPHESTPMAMRQGATQRGGDRSRMRRSRRSEFGHVAVGGGAGHAQQRRDLGGAQLLALVAERTPHTQHVGGAQCPAGGWRSSSCPCSSSS
jgi:hypothetical protein